MAGEREWTSRSLRRAGSVLLLLVALVAATPATALGDHGPTQLLSYGPDGTAATAKGKVSGDGRHTVLETDARLTSEDTDSSYDVYERTGASTTLVSIGPLGHGGADPTISENGSHIFFSSVKRLVDEDTDSAVDVYERSGGVTRLVSTGPNGENAEDPHLAGITKDGERAFFTTGSKLVPADNDGLCLTESYDDEEIPSYHPCLDLYERSGGTTKLVSIAPPGESDNADAMFLGASDDGAHVFFTMGYLEGYGFADGIFDRTGGATVKASPGASYVEVPFYPSYLKPFSNDGSRVVFTTGNKLVPEDNNGASDVYMRSNGRTTLLSAPTTGTGEPGAGYQAGAWAAGATPDFHHIFFGTTESLVSEDTGGLDMYEWSEGRLSRVTDGHYAIFRGVTDDGSHLFFETEAALTPDDLDGSCPDLYERVGDVTRLVSTGPTEQRVNNGSCGSSGEDVVGVSKDGSRVLFTTNESLTANDLDTCCFSDVYERLNGETTLVSTGASRAHFAWGVSDVQVRDDGRSVFWNTVDPLSPLDHNQTWDFYGATANRPPDCAGVGPDLTSLWPANKGLRLVGVGGAADPDGDAVSLEITGVSQDEPSGGADAAAGTDASHIYLRAERDAKGDGRAYAIAFKVTDALGATCTGRVKVSVPRHNHAAAVDSAPPSYDSFGN